VSVRGLHKSHSSQFSTKEYEVKREFNMTENSCLRRTQRKEYKEKIKVWDQGRDNATPKGYAHDKNRGTLETVGKKLREVT